MWRCPRPVAARRYSVSASGEGGKSTRNERGEGGVRVLRQQRAINASAAVCHLHEVAPGAAASVQTNACSCNYEEGMVFSRHNA